MIAASREKYDSLQLVQLVLSLRRNASTEVPESLQQRFMDIVGQARRLADDPHSASGEAQAWLPEAILLAVMLRRKDNEELAQTISELESFSSITPPVASRLLNSIESGLAA